MDYQKNCPICDSMFDHKVLGYDGGVVSEHETKCGNGCYKEYYAYGHTETYIFNERVFHENYNDSDEKRSRFQKEIDEEIAYWLNDFKYLSKLMEYEVMHNIDRINFTVKEIFGPIYISSQAVAKIKLKESSS